MRRLVVLLVGCLALGLGGVNNLLAQKGMKGPLADLPPATFPEIAKFVTQLKDKDKDRRAIAVVRLYKRGEIRAADVAAAVPIFCELATTDPDDTVREQAAYGLGIIQLEPKDAVAALTKVVEEDKSLGIKRAAALALGNFYGDAKPALAILKEGQALGAAADKEIQEAQRNKTKLENEGVRRAEADFGRACGQSIQMIAGRR
jgi:HEAT repeat protein